MTPASERNLEARRNYVGPSAARLSSALPADARAVIEREARPVTQSAPSHRRGWRLRFYPRQPLGVDPLTDWTSGADPLAHLSLRFPDLASAIRYAERHDLPYEVRDAASSRSQLGARLVHQSQDAVQLCCWPTGPHALCCGNYPLNGGEQNAQSSGREAQA